MIPAEGLARFLPGILRQGLRPQFLAYLPLAFYLVWLMLRYRSATLYTAANPGIPTGGMTGESKSAILEKLARVDGAVPEFVLIPVELGPRERVRLARQWIEQRGLGFPVVLKPDVGERGRAVRVVSGQKDLARRLVRMRETLILQRFVHGTEFGIFYRRMPGEARGQIVSIAQMSYPEVVGDGRASLAELLPSQSAREFAPQRLRYVPAAGERVALFELGFASHSATYADRRDLLTADLEEKIDTISRAHPGFFIGRFDVCAASADELRRGRLHVLELNGVSSEPMHIYDPAISIAQALRTLLRQARDAFAIGAANRAQGTVPTPASALLRLVAREHAIHLAATVGRNKS